MARSARSLVELGTYKGRSLAAMLLENPTAKAWAVDWFGDMSARGYKGATEEEMRANLAKLGLKPAGVISATTNDAAPLFTGRVELLHIDAGHSYEECRDDLANWVPKVLPGGAVCIHDYGEPHNPKLRRPEVQQAVDEWRNADEWAEVERAGTMIAFRHLVAERGALYMAYGTAAREQAQKSMATLREHAPGLLVAVVSDSPLEGADIQIYHGDMDAGARAQKTRMYSLSPFQRTLFLDADTEVRSSPDAGFGLLDYGDIVLAQDVQRSFRDAHWHALDPDERETTVGELPTEDLCYYNSGVVFFRRGERVQRLMQTWHAEWLRWKTHDQMALLRAIMRAPARIISMRAQWNTHHPHLAQFVWHNHRAARREGAPG